jgi:hypothetical protein
MPHMDTKIDIIYDIINSFPISPARQEDIKEKIRDFGAEEWNRGYDKCLYNQSCCDRSERGTREDLQDQIDDLQQQVGELQFLTAELKERFTDPGPHRMSVSRFFVEWDVESDEPGIGPKSHRLHQIVYARDAWFAENKIRVSQPHGKNFQTFPLFKEGA